MERPMKWTPDEDMQVFEKVEKIRNTIAQHDGIMPPEATTRALAIMSDYYRVMSEKAGKYKAMRDEYFASLLRDSGMTIGRAEGMAKGSEFGQKRTYYENLAAGYLEMIQALKKVMSYHENVAMQRF